MAAFSLGGVCGGGEVCEVEQVEDGMVKGKRRCFPDRCGEVAVKFYIIGCVGVESAADGRVAVLG
jgi:hypothetical protein